MKLRPHHLLCIQKFTGHGYDVNFTAHMTAIVTRLTYYPETQITVARGCDDLCGTCPNNIGGICSSLEKVTLMDSEVLRICGLAYGQQASWAKLADTARRRIFDTNGFDNICTGCQWFELCSATEVNYE